MIVSKSLIAALSVGAAAAGVTVMPAGALAVSVTMPLNPLIGDSDSVLKPAPEGEICTSAFCVVSEKSACALTILTAFEAAKL